jgi:hypothetical protein
VNSEFDLTERSAYWLGAILTDGHFRRSPNPARRYTAHVVVLNTIDREFAEAVNEGNVEMVGKEYAILHRPYVGQHNGKPFWLLQMTNKRLWSWGYEITEGKERVPRLLYAASRDVQLGFLAGVMDGDGWISVSPMRAAKYRHVKNLGASVQIGVASCSPWILDLKRLCDSMGLTSSGPYHRAYPGKAWRDTDSLRFHIEPFVTARVPMRIHRKREKLEGLWRYLESSETARLAAGR